MQGFFCLERRTPVAGQINNRSHATQKRAQAPLARSKARMKVYQFNFPEEVITRFRIYCTTRGLSLAGGVRLVVLEFMEKHEL